MSKYVYTGSHVCVLPALNRKWQHGQVYSCTCLNLFRVQEYYDTKSFEYIGTLNNICECTK